MRLVLVVLVFAVGGGRTAGAATPQSREESVTLYETMYLGSAGTPSGWTGNVAGCDAGDVSAAYRAAGIQRTDYFRIMAGLPAGLGLDATKSAGCQEAALMMSANQALDHTPPSDWTCYTTAGASAAGQSNLALGYDTLADAIRGWMQDVSTPSAGHRR